MVDPSLSVCVWTGAPEPTVAAGTGGFSSCNAVSVEFMAEHSSAPVLYLGTGLLWTFCGQRSERWDFQFHFQGWCCYWISTLSYPSGPRLCSNWSLQRWVTWIKAGFYSRLVFPTETNSSGPTCELQEWQAQGWGTLPPCPGTVPGHVSLASTMRGQQWFCPAALLGQALQSPSIQVQEMPYGYFAQHVLSMQVFGVVGDIKSAPWSSGVYSKLCQRFCPQ